MINKDLLRKTLSYIEEHPSEWDQQRWVCDTVACFAGRACLLSDYEPCEFSGQLIVAHKGDDPDDLETGWVRRGGQMYSVESAARNLLGLDEQQADKLFAMDNDLDDLREIVSDLCSE